MQLEEVRRILLVESCDNNAEAWQEEQYWAGSEPMRQVTEQHIAQDEDWKGRGEENVKLLIN